MNLIESLLTFTNEYLENGFKVTGMLYPPKKNVLCHYVINVKNEKKWDQVYRCPGESNSVYQSCSRARNQQLGSLSSFTTSAIASCNQEQLCNNIVFTAGYDETKQYEVMAMAVRESNINSVTIPSSNVHKIT